MKPDQPGAEKQRSRSFPFVLAAAWGALSLFGLKAGVWPDFSLLPAAFIPALEPSRFAWGNLLAAVLFLLRGHLACALLFTVAIGAGAGLLAFAGRPPGVGRLDRLLLGLALGCAVVSLSLLGLGLAGLLFTPVGWVLAAAGLLSAGRIFTGGEGESFRRPRLKLSSVSGILLLGLSAQLFAALLLVFTASAVPDPFYDSTVYQLAVPQLFISEHKVFSMPANAYACLPLGAPMLSTLLWLIAGLAGPRAWCFWMAGLALLAVYNLPAREGRPGAGLAAAAGLAVVPVFCVNAMWSSADVPLCFLLLVALVAAREAAERRGGGKRRWVLLCALLVGAGFSVKYTALFFAPWLFFICVSGGFKSGLRRAVLFAAASSVFILPWLVRNFSVTGNPVYPYATRVFSSGRRMEPERSEFFRSQQSAQVVKSPADVLRLPLLLARGMESENFIGPALLALLPVAVLFAPPLVAFRIYAWLALPAFLFWAPLSSVMRYLLAAWGLVFALIMMGAWRAEEKRRGFRAAVLLVLFGAGFYSLNASVSMWKKAFDPVEVLAGRERAWEFLERRLVSPYASFAAAADALMPERGKVMMVGDARGLYWPRSFIAHSAYDTEAFEEIIRSSRTAREAVKRLRQTGASHIFVNDAETARMKFAHGYPILLFTGPQLAVIGELWREWLHEEMRTREAGLFALRRSPVPGRGAGVPLSFDTVRLRMEFAGWTMMTWEGDARMFMRKEAK